MLTCWLIKKLKIYYLKIDNRLAILKYNFDSIKSYNS